MVLRNIDIRINIVFYGDREQAGMIFRCIERSRNC